MLFANYKSQNESAPPMNTMTMYRGKPDSQELKKSAAATPAKGLADLALTRFPGLRSYRWAYPQRLQLATAPRSLQEARRQSRHPPSCNGSHDAEQQLPCGPGACALDWLPWEGVQRLQGHRQGRQLVPRSGPSPTGSKACWADFHKPFENTLLVQASSCVHGLFSGGAAAARLKR